MWTHFWDMNSGGGRKEPYAHIYIEAPEDEAKVIFYNRFGHNPERITCTCCGEDYSILSDEDFAQLTGYHRGCDSGYVLEDGSVVGHDEFYKASFPRRRELNAMFRYFERPSARWKREYQTVDEYKANDNVLVINADDILDRERHGAVPEQGYVWVD